MPKTTRRHGGFTMIEMLISITIFSIVIIMAFDALGNVSFLNSKISNRLDINGELYAALEQVIATIKSGGGIDYEEYWNRSVVGLTASSGHYALSSGFGNYGSGGNIASNSYGDSFYYCISGSGTSMWTGGCLTGFNTYGGSVIGKYQRYGQYKLQFIDFNSNANGDGGDEDDDGKIVGDDDDEDLLSWPVAFTGGQSMRELYLIKKDNARPERLLLRWNVKQDPNAPAGATCDLSTASWSGCLGNIQILRLVGRDIGNTHNASLTSSGKYDGRIDTWECESDFHCLGANNLPTGADWEWVDLFPDSINVEHVEFFPFPDKDVQYTQKENDFSRIVNPYVRLNITLWISWERRRKLRFPAGDVTVSTTINLSQ